MNIGGPPIFGHPKMVKTEDQGMCHWPLAKNSGVIGSIHDPRTRRDQHSAGQTKETVFQLGKWGGNPSSLDGFMENAITING